MRFVSAFVVVATFLGAAGACANAELEAKVKSLE